MIVLISGVGAGDTGGWEQIGKNSWHWPVMSIANEDSILNLCCSKTTFDKTSVLMNFAMIRAASSGLRMPEKLELTFNNGRGLCNIAAVFSYDFFDDAVFEFVMAWHKRSMLGGTCVSL